VNRPFVRFIKAFFSADILGHPLFPAFDSCFSSCLSSEVSLRAFLSDSEGQVPDQGFFFHVIRSFYSTPPLTCTFVPIEFLELPEIVRPIYPPPLPSRRFSSIFLPREKISCRVRLLSHSADRFFVLSFPVSGIPCSLLALSTRLQTPCEHGRFIPFKIPPPFLFPPVHPFYSAPLT